MPDTTPEPDDGNIEQSIFGVPEVDADDRETDFEVNGFVEHDRAETTSPEPIVGTDRISRRRADIDTKQDKVGKLLEELGCEGVVLLMPAHVSWFTGGINVRGLIADGERPGVYTNGRQRWLLASNVDAQRLFDEELDGLGFQLKEWQWGVGRAVLLGELVHGKKFATDRPFPNMPLVNDRLRTELRPLSAYERELYAALGSAVTHALEATARNSQAGQSEQEIAGQLAHRLYRHGVEAVGLSVAVDDRAKRFRRAGFTEATAERVCVLQATGMRDGLYVTASRTVCFGPPEPDFRLEFDTAVKLSAVYRSQTRPGATVGAAAEAGRVLTHGTDFEHDWRAAQQGYGAGRFPAEELRKANNDEKFATDWPIVWQARVHRAAVVDTMLVSDAEPIAVTPPDGWPFKRIRIRDHAYDVPDLLTL